MVMREAGGSPNPSSGKLCGARLALHHVLASTAAQKGEQRKQAERMHLSFTVGITKGTE